MTIIIFLFKNVIIIITIDKYEIEYLFIKERKFIMIIIMFAGAGSVGKTTQLKLLSEHLINKNYKVDTFESNTRKTYEKYCMQKESDALSKEEFNKNFQNIVMREYTFELMKQISKAKYNNIDFFITDRSPFDYLGYYLSVFQNDLTINKIEEKRQVVYKAISSIEESNNKIIYINNKYPRHWSKDTESSDGWRADKTGKNYVWSSIVTAEIELWSDTKGKKEIAFTPEQETIELINKIFNLK